MKWSQFAVLIVVIVLCLGFTLYLRAQSPTYAAITISATIGLSTQCPAVSANAFIICPTTDKGVMMSVNGASYFSIPTSTGATYTGTAPIVVSGSNISCPSCATGGVATFNGRTGDVKLTKSDVTSLGLAVSTSVTSTATSTVQ